MKMKIIFRLSHVESFLKKLYVCMYLCIKMESYCLKCKKYTKNINPQVSGTSNGKLMILSKCAICDNNKSRFINKQEVKVLLSKLGIKTPLSKIPILDDFLF